MKNNYNTHAPPTHYITPKIVCAISKLQDNKQPKMLYNSSISWILLITIIKSFIIKSTGNVTCIYMINYQCIEMSVVDFIVNNKNYFL